MAGLVLAEAEPKPQPWRFLSCLDMAALPAALISSARI
jgi:hypothetical protein